MAAVQEELNHLFAAPGTELPTDVQSELQAILRLHDIDAQELFYKWESYSMKMGAEETKLDLKTARDFKRDLQELLEAESRSKAHARVTDKRNVAATPRPATNGDVFGMLDNLATPGPRAINGSSKRKSNFETPASKYNKNHVSSSPAEYKTPHSSKDTSAYQSTSFSDRPKRGDIEQTIFDHIEIPEPLAELPPEPRLKIKANTDLSKFNYRTMAMKVSEASEVLDDRIDEFLELVKEHYKLEDSAFGNAAGQSTSEIVAVGRIACDSSEGKLNSSSLVLETSRRTGAGHRVALKVDGLPAYDFFPGRIVALRGTNASGDFFTVSEILSMPILSSAASYPSDLDASNDRLTTPTGDSQPLNIIIASGPYTPDTDLSFAALDELLNVARTSCADGLILLGPFIDAEHPLIRSGDYDPPPNTPTAAVPTLADLFRHHISSALSAFSTSVPSCSIVLVPSLRDAVSRQAAWPQDRFAKRELGLPKQASCVTNPMTLSLNEIMIGMSSLDALDMLRREECVGGQSKSAQGSVLDRGPRALIEQRHFLPLFPPTARENLPAPTSVEEIMDVDEEANGDGNGSGRAPFLPVGASIDLAYLKLGEWIRARPDMLITPSVLPPFARVVESVLVINPGPLAKRRGYGTYARVTVLPREVTDDERETESQDRESGGGFVSHKLYERTRVDIIRI